MKDMNGVQVFDDGETPESPVDSGADFEVLSTFGFKVVEHKGKKMWKVGTEKDYREAEAKRLGISPEKVSIDTVCHQTAPMSCSGECSVVPRSCTLCFNPTSGYYYCTCV